MKTFIATFASIIFVTLSASNIAFADFCYPDGCVTYNYYGFPQANFTGIDQFIQAVINQLINTHGNKADAAVLTKNANGAIIAVTCYNSVPVFSGTRCDNLAIDYPTCSNCGAGSTLQNGVCACNNRATDPPSCGQCPAGFSLSNNLCICTNGATDFPNCQVCPTNSSMTGGQCLCANGATPQSNCTQCPANQVMYNNQCTPSCTLTNVCGQQIQGVTINGTCSTVDGSSANNSCIQNFNVDTSTVNPNGNVNFSWTLASTPGVSSKCGFVDLTTPTPRLIPGLQNLDPKIDTARISNIQTTTRFCLICQFYNLVNNAALGQAQVHQWVRVLRIGEE